MGDKSALTAVKGIGTTIAERFVESGIDSLEKLAEASEEQLAEIKGIQPNVAPDIIEQAKKLAIAEKRNEATLGALTLDTGKLKDDVEALVLHIRDRFSEDVDPGNKQKALRKEISRTLASLEKVEAALSEQLRRLGKGLAKADAKISKVTDSGVEEVLVGLRKARKKIEDAVE